MRFLPIFMSVVFGLAACSTQPTVPSAQPSAAPTEQQVGPEIVGPQDLEPLPAPDTTDFPGTQWTYLGQAVGSGVMTLLQGPEHCAFHGITILTVGWPLGRSAQTDLQTRQYIRDPEHEFAEETLASFEPSVTLPASAAFTGYRYGTDELWMSLEDVDTRVYIVRDGVIEQWPRSRSRESFACF